MRRLLAFGTGAALIGIVLLIVAFYEAYVIVSALESQIASQVNINLVLEDATLEAIFLGVMVALGYGLVTQGFNGIRRQELLELQDAAEGEVVKTRVMAKIERERVVEKERKSEVRHVVAPMGPVASSTAQSADSTSSSSSSNSQGIVMIIPQGTPSTPAEPQPAQSTPDPTVSPAPPVYPSYSREFRATPEPMSSQTVEEPGAAAEKPASESSAVSASTSDSSAAVSPSVVASAEPQEAPTLSPQTDLSKAENTEGTTGPDVVWAGGPPPALEGVQILPEPTERTDEFRPTTASLEETANEDQSAEAASGTDLPKKRGRGRPKGSKSKKNLPEENSGT